MTSAEMTLLSNTKRDSLSISQASGNEKIDGMVQLPAPEEQRLHAPDSNDKPASPAAHWRRRGNSAPMPADEAARQGNIASLAFRILGKDAAIAFLNTEHSGLGGRPIAIATKSKAGEALVRAELESLAPAVLDKSAQNDRPGR